MIDILLSMKVFTKSKYRIAGKFGKDFNLLLLLLNFNDTKKARKAHRSNRSNNNVEYIK